MARGMGGNVTRAVTRFVVGPLQAWNSVELPKTLKTALVSMLAYSYPPTPPGPPAV